MQRCERIEIAEDSASPSGRGREARARQGEASRKCEGLKIRIELKPSPGAPACWLSRRPLPRGEAEPSPSGRGRREASGEGFSCGNNSQLREITACALSSSIGQLALISDEITLVT